MSVSPLLDQIVRHFDNPRQNGSGVHVTCPCHEDQRQSLHVSIGKNGDIVLKCHAGCETSAILAARGLTFSDLFSHPKDKTAPGKRLVDTIAYDYHDENGKLLFQALRKQYSDGTKDFMQRRPVQGGGWDYKLGDTRRVLFGLPDIINSDPSAAVRMVEGEKDVIRAKREKRLATTSPMGAGKWRPEYANTLRGRVVALLPDNDLPGFQHMLAVHRSLDGVAERTPIILLDVPPKGDLSDWLDAGGAMADLDRLIFGDATQAPGARLIDIEELQRLAGETATNETSETNSETIAQPQFNLTDLGNAERLIAKHGADMRYCKLWAKWIVFDGRRWDVDNTMQVERWAQDVVRGILQEAADAADLEMRQKLAKHALTSEQARRIAGMVELARARVPINPGQLDQDIWLLNCQNGTVNLKTNELRPHDRNDYITKLAPVDFDPNARAPRWESFMLQVAAGDAEQVAFTKRALGYSICGDQSERILLLCWGGGRNGKTVMVETVAATLGGDYASTLPAESLMQRRGGDDDRLMQRRAELRGARFVVASETGEGARLNEALIKSLTGNERITARQLYGEQFEFDPTHTLWLATNHKPSIRDTTNSIWDRMKLIPFSVRFVTDEDATGEPGEIWANKKLGKELMREKQGILAWLVAGCLEWQQNGIGSAKRIKEATQEYRTDEDLLGRFIGECCHVTRQAVIPASQIYGAYTEWCEENGERPITQTAFGRALTERGFERKRQRTGIEWRGLGLRLNPASTGDVNGCERCEPPFDKPPHENEHTEVSGETVNNHTQPYTQDSEEVF